MTTLTHGSHRRRMLFLLAGVVLTVVAFFATRRVASYTDRAVPVAMSVAHPPPHAALPQTLPFILADFVSYFSSALVTTPSASDDRFVFTSSANGHAEDVFRIAISADARDLVVAFSGGGDYGLTLAREFFEAPFFTRDETLSFFTLLEESREAPATAKLPRCTVRFTYVGHRDDFHLTLRFTPAAS